MRTKDTILPDIDPAIKWIARVVGGILLTSVAVFFINYGGTLNLFRIRSSELVMTLALLAALLGLLVGWVWEGLGGLLTLTGLLVFTISSYVASGNIEWHVWLLAAPASLFIAYWWRMEGCTP